MRRTTATVSFLRTGKGNGRLCLNKQVVSAKGFYCLAVRRFGVIQKKRRATKTAEERPTIVVHNGVSMAKAKAKPSHNVNIDFETNNSLFVESTVVGTSAKTDSGSLKQESEKQAADGCALECECEYPQLTLYYANLRNKGNWVRLILEESGIPYGEVSAIREIAKLSMAICHDASMPLMAMPALEITEKQKSSFYISEASTICRYAATLSKVPGMLPNDTMDRYRVDMLANSVFTFHNTMNASFIAKLETMSETAVEKHFLGNYGSVDKWMHLFDRQLRQTAGGYFFGEQMSYADLCLFNSLDGAIELFDRWQKDLFQEVFFHRYPLCAKLYQNVKQRPAVSKLLKRQKEKRMGYWGYLILGFGTHYDAADAKLATILGKTWASYGAMRRGNPSEHVPKWKGVEDRHSLLTANLINPLDEPNL